MLEKPHEVTALPTNNPPNPFSSFGQQAVFTPNRQAVLSLVETISGENQLLKAQQENLQKELKKLKGIAEGLLKENVQLRGVYRERTHDIAKLANTISINTHQALSDYQHRQFLMKELNCSVLKQIKLLASQIETADQAIRQSHQQTQEVSDSRIRLEQHIVNKIKIKLKSDLGRKKLDQLKQAQIREMEALNDMSVEVTGLVLENKDLEEIIRNHQQSSYGLQGSLQKEKQQWAARVKELRAQNNKYRSEVANDEADLQRMSEQLRYKESKHDSLRESLTEQIRKKERYARICQQLNAESQKTKGKIAEYRKRISIAQNRLDQIKHEKNETADKVLAAKTKLESIRRVQQAKAEEADAAKEEQLRGLRDMMTRKEHEFEAQKLKQRREQDKVDAALNQLKNQEENLSAMLEQFNNLIKEKVINPTKEIEQIQLGIRLKKLKLK